jgi:hypothetical protein
MIPPNPANPAPVDPDSAALAECVTDILKVHDLRAATIRVVEIEDGWHEVWTEDHRLGAIPPETVALRAQRIRMERN